MIVWEASMKTHFFPLLACVGILFAGCNSNKADNDVVSQQFIHKYGFDVSEREWEERAQDGLVVTMMKNGVRATHTYENGLLHGTTTFTFPHSNVVEKLMTYDQGTLLKEVFHDANGIPVREEVHEFDDRNVITLWDEKGAPLSIEEYSGELLLEGKYYTSGHELEGQVENGSGVRVKRDRNGLLVCQDHIEKGMISQRTSYHPNGQIQSISNYDNYQLHGEQIKNTPSGKPLMVIQWNHGAMHGVKTVYRNGIKIAEIPYQDGLRHGTEIHYDDLGALVAEIQWKNDKKHGVSYFHSEDTTENEWFFKGQRVDAEKFAMLENRQKIVAQMNADVN
jgi:antitoxin component YwqK of YwqJK toxin-antitoxin module